MRHLLHAKFAKSLVCTSIFATLFLLAGRATAQTTDTWSNTGGTAWLTGTNWSTGAAPTAGSIATFSVDPTSTTTATITNSTQSVGAVSVLTSHTSTLSISNTSTVGGSTLTLTGATINSVANTIISDLISGTKTFSFVSPGSGSNPLNLSIATTGGATIVGGGGTNSAVGNTTLISSIISETGTQALTYLGGGNYDPNLNTGGVNGGLLELAGINTITGGITIGDNTGSPTYGNSGALLLDNINSWSNTAGNNITVNTNSQLYLENVASGTFNTSNITLTLNGIGNNKNSGALRASGTPIVWPGPIVLGSAAEITTAGGTTVFSVTGTVTGNYTLQFQGSGEVILTNSGNSWANTQTGNGTTVVAAGGSFSTGSLTMAQTSTNVPLIIFNQPTQTIGLFSGNYKTGASGSNTLQLNGTRLTINQTANGEFGDITNSTCTSEITGTGSIIKTGTGSLQLVNSATTGSLSGGLNISQGEILFTPLASTTFNMPAPDTLSGGSIGTTGILASATVSLNVLTVTSSSNIYIDPSNVHRIIFANSSASNWTAGQTLIINNWTGNYAGGTSGTMGQIFFGTNASGLTAAQLAQIQFYDGTNYWPATLLSTGELVPAPSITTTSASFGPFCNGVSNSFSVYYTTTGTFSGTYSVQLSDGSGSFTSATVIGTGSSSPIAAFIPSGTAAGTGYRVRVINSNPAVNGNDNGSDINIIAAPTAYSVSGSGAICTGTTGVDIQLSNSQTGVNYQLYNGVTIAGSAMPGTTGSAIDFGPQTGEGTYTVLATSTSTGSCTQVMNGSGSVTINALPGASITGTTLITPGNTATLTINDTNSYNSGSGDVVYFTDGVSTYSVTMGHGSNTFVTPSLSATTTYSVTSAVSVFGCIETVTGQTATVYVSATPTAIITGATAICPVSQGGSAVLTFTGTSSGLVNYTDGTSTYSVTLSSGTGGVGTNYVIVYPLATTTYSLISIVSGGTYTLTSSADITISTLPTVYSMTGGGYCAGTAGTTIGLSGSDSSSTTYQLYNGGTPEGSVEAGANAAISFGVYSVAGTYTVMATNSLGCYDAMNGSATPSVNPLPSPYTLDGTGAYCNGGDGLPTTLSNTQTGVSYQLYNGATPVGLPVEGFGGATGFGDQPAGTYTVLGTYTLTGCSNAMTGSIVITTVNPLSAGAISGADIVNVTGIITLSDPTGASGGVWSSTNATTGTINSSTGVFSALAAGTTTISYAVTNVCGTNAATSIVTVNSETTGEVVISQIYPAGGKTSAVYNTEFVELFNPTSSAITMTNWSLQYVAAAGGTMAVNKFSGTIAAHSYFLIALATGGTGSAIPTPDASPSSPSSPNSSNGQLALVANITAVTTTAGDMTSVMIADHIIDFIGYGTATSYLAAAAPTPTATLADFRGLNGCLNATNNSSDFSTGSVAPRNSSSATNVCPSPVAFYSKSSGNLDAPSTWGENADGSGTNPTDFITVEQTFHIANGNPGNFSGSTWTVSGTGSVVNIDDATDFTIPGTTTVNATINVGAGRTLTIANSTLPTFGALDAASTVVYSGLSGLNLPTTLVYGNLTLANTPVTNTTGATLSFDGNFILTGTSSFNVPGTAIQATGTGDQTINGNGTTLSMDGFTDEKASGKMTLISGTTMNLNAGSLTMILSGGAANQFIDGGNTIYSGNNIDLSGTASSYNFTGTIVLNGNTTGSQNIRGGSGAKCVATLNNLVMAGTLQAKLNPTGGSNLTLSGNLIFTSAATGVLNFEGDTLKLGGSFSDSTTTDLLSMGTTGSMLEFNGSSAQTYYSNVTGGNTVNNLYMNNNNGLTLMSHLNVSGALTLTNGEITNGSNVLTLASTGTTTGANSSSYVNGTLIRTGASSTSLFFPIGDATYSPVQLSFGASITGQISVTSNSGQASAIATSGISASNDVNKYWVINNLGSSASSTTVNVGLDYSSSDLTGSGNSGYMMAEYNGSSWTLSPSITNSTSGVSPLPADATTSTGISGASFSGTYIAGGSSCPNVYGMTGGGNYCSGTSGRAVGLDGSDNGVSYVLYNGATPVYTVTGTGSSVSFGLQLAGTYSVIGTNVYSSCSTNMSGAETVTLEPLPTATITGTASICSSTSTTISAAGTPFATVYLSDGTSSITIGVGGTGSTNVSPTVATTYTGTVTSTFGCTQAATGSAVISIIPASAGTITGASSICGLNTITLTDANTGGVWSSANTAIASVSGSLVTGVGYGTATISYILTNTCGTYTATTTVSVNPEPPVPVLSSGLLSFCSTSPAELTVAYGDTTSGTLVDSTGFITQLLYSTTATYSGGFSVSLPAGAIITNVRATINVAGVSSGNSEQRNFGFNLKAPDGSIICLTNSVGSSTAGTGSFPYITWGSDGTTAYPGSGTPYVTGNDYITSMASGVPTGTTEGGWATTGGALVTDKSNATLWSSLFTTVNGTWTLYGGATYSNTTAIDTMHGWILTINYKVPPTTVTWAPLAGLYTTSAGSGGASYGGGNTGSVYVQPTTTTIYTVSATTGSCTSASTVVADYGTSLYVPSITSSSSSECVGISTIAETDSSTGGVWTSNNTSIAAVGSVSGIVSGVAGGSATITYTLASGSCSGYSTTNVTINALPILGGISGNTTLCTSASPSTLSDSPSGGVWSSTNTAVATIGSTSGQVVASGTNVGSTATISYTYTDGNGCVSNNTTAVNVTIAPTSITISPANVPMCTASSPAMLVVSGGDLTGPATATTGIISTSVGTGSQVVTSPLTISGIPATATITNVAVTLNFNSSSLYDYLFNLEAPNGKIINLINNNGGPATGAYTNTIIDSTSTNQLSLANSPYTGTYAATFGLGNLTRSAGGGSIPTYSATATSWAALGTTGTSANGTWTLISYNSYTGTTTSTLTGYAIAVTYNMPVSAVWSPISGLYTNTSGTTYSSTFTDTVYVYPASNGTYTFTATSSNGACSSSGSSIVTMNSTLAVPAITGTPVVCQGSLTSLSDPASGGTWTSTANATVDGSGNVTGVNAGTATISYFLTTGPCSGFITQTITINPLPSVLPIDGNTGICFSGGPTTTTLSDGTSGTYSWSSSAPSIATIDSSTGIVTAVSTGNTIISYTYNDGICSNSSTVNVTVSNMPGTVSVSPSVVSVCPSGPAQLLTALAIAPASTTASSGLIGVVCNTVAPTATALTISGVPAGATVTGVSVNFNITAGFAGTAVLNLVAPNNQVLNLLYTGTSNNLSNYTNTTISSAGTTPIPNSNTPGAPWTGVWAADEATAVQAEPGTAYSVTATSWSSLEAGSPNGTWTLAGLDNYETDNFEITSWSITVSYTYPVPITWSSEAGLYTNSGGSISYGGTNTDTVYAFPGVSTVYTVTANNNGCTNTSTATTNISTTLIVSAISGTPEVCQGSATTLSDANAGGAWSSSTANATVGTLSGIVTGASAGTSMITYTLTSGGCSGYATTTVTVNPTPVVGAINGNTNLCFSSSYIDAGPASALSDTTGGGTWSSSNTMIATIGTNGTLTGVYPGSSVITYLYNNGTCSNSTTVNATVNASPVPISVFPSTTSVCANGPAAMLITSGGDIQQVTSFSTSVTQTATAGSPGTQAISPIVISSMPDNATITDIAVTINTVRVSGADNSDMIINLLAPDASILNLINREGGSKPLNMVNTTISSEGAVAMSSTTVFSITATAPYQADAVLDTGYAGYKSNTSRWSDLENTANGTWSLLADDGYTSGSGKITSWTLTVYYTVPSNTTVWTPISGLYTNSGATSSYSGSEGSEPDTVYALPASTSTYTVTSSSGACTSTSTATVIVNPAPTVSGILGGNNVCVNSGISLTDTTSGTSSSWSSSNTAIAFVNSSGMVSAFSTPGTATITYSVTNSFGCSNYTTTTITVNPLPTTSASTSGAACAGGTVTLNPGATGAASYSWSGPGEFSSTLSNPALVGSTLVAGSYSVIVTSVFGCNATSTTNVTIDTISVLPYNSGYACNGGTVSLFSVESGSAPSVTYSWHGPDSYSSLAPNPVLNSATVSRSGIYTVTASSGGSGCTAIGTTLVTVDTFNVLVSNNGPACVGTSLSLAAALVGTVSPVSYIWSGPLSFSSMSADTLVTDSAILSMGGDYTLSISASGSGCTVTKTTNALVNAIPVPISGNLNVCVGLTRTLTDGSGGGTWSSSNGNAMVGLSTGVVTGEVVGTATIYYTFGTSCSVNTIVTINPNPAPITGITKVCIGSITSLTDATPLGSWFASNSNATVDSVGNVQGVTAGTVGITYLSPGGCYYPVIVTVNSLPAIIFGSTTICSGSSTTLSDATTGGTWTSSNTLAATIGSAADPATLTGVGAGTATIVYTSAAGCTRYTNITVNATPVITGTPAAVCVGSTVTLSDDISGGTWSSSAVGKGTVGASTGIVYGVASGTTTISYQSTLGCVATTAVTINPISAILGTGTLCQGSTTSLSDATTGGTWTSLNGAVATFGGTTGLLTAGSVADTVTVVYQTGLGCTSSALITVNPITPIIGLPASICVGSTDTLTDNTPGGAWSSSVVAKGTIDPSAGIVYGLSSGTTVITYLVGGTGCKATGVVSVNPISAILGGTVMCSGSTLTLSDGTSGGTWTSGNPSAATVGSTGSPVTVTGVPSAVTNTTTITYATAAGCTSNITITVNPTPALSGTNAVCIGLGTTLLTNVSGGTWSSSSTAVAGVDGSGDITGLSAGTSKISYVSSLGCGTSITVSVNSNPGAVLGGKIVCPGMGLSLSDGTTGGSWAVSGDVSLAGTGSGLVIGGVSAGTGVVTYALGTGCSITDTITVATPPAPIGTIAALCAGSMDTLTDGVAGGTWSSSNTSIAKIGSTGVLTAVAGGAATISYTTAAGCTTTSPVNVNAILPITGSTNICLNDTTVLADGGGGTWSTSSPGISVADSSGVVTGLSVGTGTVVYTLASGCSRSIVVLVNPLPDSIQGNTLLCMGATSALSDDGGGNWSMSSSYATVVASTGVVTASSSLSGTATLTYTAGVGAGCAVTTVVTVAPNPTVIQGPASECQGITIMLTDATGNGTWSGSAVTAAFGSTTTLTGTTVGTSTVTYTLGTGCATILLNTVKPNPSAIFGTGTLCIGGTTALSDSTSGGISWTSSNTSIATVYGQYVTGQSVGMDTITYKLSTGCFTTTIVTVNNLPSIGGNTIGSICTGTNLSLTAGTGAWSSSNTLVATVGTSGIVNALSGGTATISFSGSGGSGCVATTIVTVTSVAAISGPGSVCSNGTVTLNDGTSGGTWSSGNLAVATIAAGTGVVSGVSYGTVVISYNAPSCTVTAILSVNAAPQLISGNLGVCAGFSSILSDTTTGGMWSSGNSAILSIGSSSGIITGNAAGTVGITYTSSGCYKTTTVTVNVQPGTIHGSLSVCTGSMVSLSDATSGGSWSVSGATATIGSTTGILSGVSGGTATVSYIISGTGCQVGTTVSVNIAPEPLTSTGMCAGSTITLADTILGGSWTVSSPLISVDGLGDVTADSGTSGSAVVTYTLPGGCLSTATITVTNLPSAILGSTSVCSGQTLGLSNTSSGGTWSSNTGSVATVGSTTGSVLGVSAGTSVISYSVGTGCLTSETVTVYALPQAITGDSLLCAGTSSALVDTGSGTWSMSSSYATVVGATGVVTASASLYGTATVTYTAAVTGCIAVTTVTVTPNPAAIQGAASECQGVTIMLTDATGNGTWSGSAVTAAFGSATTLTGTTVGTSTVTYTLGTGCAVTLLNTVKPNPSAIFGTGTLCIGGTTALSDSTSGGVSWTSSNTSIATVSGQYVTGQSVGIDTITYKLSTGCSVTTTVSVISASSYSIGGNPGISECPGASFILTDGASGSWSSSNTVIATVGTDGTVTGVSGGTATITFTPIGASGCTAVTVITINAAPAITGATSVCTSGSVTLVDGSGGGTWSSGNASIATVGSSTGLVSGVGAGPVVISYTTAAHCIVTTTVTVTAAPTSIGGPVNKVCVGNTITLSDNTFGGAWSSSNTAVGTVDGSGNVTGIGSGTTLITYGSGGCYVSAAVTVNSLPGTINGASGVCSGATTTLTDMTTGGVWSITGGTATIGSTTGVVTGTASGAATVSYTIASTGCSVGTILTINGTAGPITGNSVVCVGGTGITLSDGGSGTWSSSNTAIVQVGSGTGLLTGEAAGTATISYLSGGCYAKTIVTVSGVVGVVKGATSVCQGLTLSLSDATTGGTWSSSNTPVATVGTNGIVTGVITGATSSATANIIYTSAAGCTASVTISVNPVPVAIHGDSSLCTAQTATLTDGTVPGTWSMGSSYATVVGSTGVVTANASGLHGTATLTYTSGGCYVTDIITVNTIPGAVQGASGACSGTTFMLSDVTLGGSWSGTGAAISGSGTSTTFVAGAAGTVSVTYTLLSTGCASQVFTTTIFRNPSPILGASTMCTGVTTALSDTSVTGGLGWSSSNTAVATVSGAYVTGHIGGTAIITYKLTAGSCYTTDTITMKQTPIIGAIVAPSTISHSGSVVTISDTTVGGLWTSSSTTIALIGSTYTTTSIEAIATVSSGSSVISYAVTTAGCTGMATKTIGAATVVRPGGGTTTGSTTVVYAGSAVALPADDLEGGIWSSSDNGIATVENGLVTGIMPGVVSIRHELTGDDGTVTASVTDVVVTAIPASISLVPNPNKGTFVVKGTVGSVGDEEVTIEVTDVLGQVLYSGKVMAQGGKLNETVTLNNALANGMYMLNVKSGTENKTIHFVIEQ